MSWQIPFDVSYHFDEHLRDVPNNADQMRLAVNWLICQQKNSLDVPVQQQLLGLIGVYSRMLGDLNSAHDYLQQSLALSEQLEDERSKTVTRIRLAHVYQWQKQYNLCDRLLVEEIYRCQTQPILKPYLDFAYQHAGKSKYEQGDYQTAYQYFLQALIIRQQKGNAELLDSTHLALEKTRYQIELKTGYSKQSC
jgi:tetratricopeptide (TPR) repeat protein